MSQLRHSSSLNAGRRLADLEALRDGGPVDVLVVGGGVTGAGVALDAAARGLSVALVERRDLAWGTSRWSSKLVHGGLRYLAQGAVGIAFESARERDVLLRRTAPHLLRAIPIVVPLLPYLNRRAERLGFVGFRGGDVLRRISGTPPSRLPRTRRATPAEALALTPGVRREGLRGALVAWDCQLEDDARLVVAIARTAAARGARIVTRCGALELAGDGARLRDELAGEQFDLRARAVVNAAGVWAGELDRGLRLRPSRGTHVVVDAAALGGLAGTLHVPVPGEKNRWVFAVGHRSGRALIGLTDEPAGAEIPDVPHPPEADVDFLVQTLAAGLERPLRREHVRGAFAGLRPLLDDGSNGRTSDLSRRHAVTVADSGAIRVVGGKLTTYRLMAQDAVDAAVARAGLDAGPCVTARLPLVGAAAPGRLAAVDAPPRLVDRYGVEAPRVLAEAADEPALLEPVLPGSDVLAAELRFALRHEGAMSPDDLLDRRTRIGLVAAEREAARTLAERLVDAELGTVVAR